MAGPSSRVAESPLGSTAQATAEFTSTNAPRLGRGLWPPELTGQRGAGSAVWDANSESHILC